MNIAYLILTYRNPPHLERMVAALSVESCEFFVHVDKKSNLAEFCSIRGNNLYFLEDRVPVYWGEYSQVEAILSLVRKALASAWKHKYLVLLTGSCYPLRSGRYIDSFLQKNTGSEFMGLTRIPNVQAGQPLKKINTIRDGHSHPVRRFLCRCLGKIGLDQRDYRRYLYPLGPFSGFGAWALTREACDYILQFDERNPRIRSFFQCTTSPDESYFHTILGNSPFALKMHRHLHFEDWSTAGKHPAWLTERNVDVWEQQREVWINDVWGEGELLFARKFPVGDTALLDRVDHMIRQKGDQLASGPE